MLLSRLALSRSRSRQFRDVPEAVASTLDLWMRQFAASVRPWLTPHRRPRGDIDNRQVPVLDAAGWQGRSTAEIAGFLVDLPLVTGISKVVAWCRDHVRRRLPRDLP